jgi:hypothetical protein
MTSEQAERIAKLLEFLIEQNTRMFEQRERLAELLGTEGPIYRRLGALLPGAGR